MNGGHTAMWPTRILIRKEHSCSFGRSTPTTQAAGTPAASAAADTVVASSVTTGNSPASTFVVTSTVTTPSSPKRTMSLGDYKKALGNTLFARDELEALFDVGTDADMVGGERQGWRWEEKGLVAHCSFPG
ncbi:unnamed protein product [Phytophthora fragariaefolia]|uniref:Unnamed protein product n=1 Tax=Phytophthora fragariaefolia TaxID=1490495 RepID=A0A9W6U1D5_9STRA|nr:unnamed protein product [Phytophthora fragariaefolia]